MRQFAFKQYQLEGIISTANFLRSYNSKLEQKLKFIKIDDDFKTRLQLMIIYISSIIYKLELIT